MYHSFSPPSPQITASRCLLMLDADLKAAMLVEPAGLAGHRPSALHGHAILVLQNVMSGDVTTGFMGDVSISYKLDYKPRTAERFIFVWVKFLYQPLGCSCFTTQKCRQLDVRPLAEKRSPKKSGTPTVYRRWLWTISKSYFSTFLYIFNIILWVESSIFVHHFSYRSPRTDISDISLDKAGIPRRTCWPAFNFREPHRVIWALVKPLSCDVFRPILWSSVIMSFLWTQNHSIFAGFANHLFWPTPTCCELYRFWMTNESHIMESLFSTYLHNNDDNDDNKKDNSKRRNTQTGTPINAYDRSTNKDLGSEPHKTVVTS